MFLQNIMKILIVEDHPKLRENIAHFLKIHSYTVDTAHHGEEALEKVRYTEYDTILLDINMPVMDGKEFLENIRKLWKDTPVIVLTSNSMLEDKLELFDMWSDDYITKPFELQELLARIKALSKRRWKSIEEIEKIGDFCLHISKHKVFLWDTEIILSNKEYLIVEFLVLNKWIPKSKTQILEKVWGDAEQNLEFSSTTLEAHISTIRKKMWKNFIKTQKGVGYIVE